jgi:chemotaxis protein MotB
MSPEKQTRPHIIVKKVHGGGHHGGAWKVAYADFITALMALFLLLWLVGQGAKVKKAVAEYFRNPGVFDKEQGSGILPGGQGLHESGGSSPTPNMSGARADEMMMLERMGTHLKDIFDQRQTFEKIRNQIRINVTREGLEIQIVEKASQVLFEIGSSEPRGYTRDVLVEIAKEIAKIPNKVIIGGHTDRRPYADGRGYTNWELSTDRANSARRVLVANGMKYEQVERIVGHADESLLDPSNPYADANRRITILVLPRIAGSISPVQNASAPAIDKQAVGSPAPSAHP